MQSIIYQDRCSGAKYIFNPKYPAQRSFFELKRSERIEVALKELKSVANINIYLFKRSKLRLIAQHGF